jgi:hypothetical protein
MAERIRKMKWGLKALIVAKIASIGAVSIAGLLVVVLALFLLRPIRNGLLSVALPRIERALPGDLSVGSAGWPAPGRLEFERLLWTDGADTLLSADRLGLAVVLRDFARRDIHIHELAVEGASADVPAILDRFPGGESQQPDPGDGPGFPRQGSVPGVPSVAAENLAIDAQRLRLPEGVELRDVVVRADVELRRGRPPRLTIPELTLAETASGARVDSLWLDVDLQEWKFEGNGTVEIPGGQSWYLRSRSDEDHRFWLSVTAQSDAEPPDVAGVALEGQARFDEDVPESVDFTLAFRTPGTEELLTSEPLARVMSDPLSRLAPLDGVVGSVTGSARMRPAKSFDAKLEVGKNNWLNAIHADVSYRDDTLDVERLEIDTPGLKLSGSAQLPPEGGSATVRLRLTDSGWISTVVPAASGPDGTTADITVVAGGLTGDSDLTLDVTGSASAGGTAIDTIDVAAVVSRGGRTPFVVDALVGAFGTSVSTRADIQASPDVAVKLYQSPTRRGANRLTGELYYSPDDKTARLKDVRLAGALGSHTINAALDETGRGDFSAELSWALPPPVLFARLQGDSTSLARADSAWRAEGPFGIGVTGDVTPSPGGRAPAVSALAELRLPGPRHLPPVIATGVKVDDLGPIEGTLAFSTGVCDSGATYEVKLDLDDTAWLDTARVDASGCGSAIQIEKLLFAFENLVLEADGGMTGDEISLNARLGVADSLLLTRILPGSSAPSVSLDATLDVDGPRDAPRVGAQLTGRLTSTFPTSRRSSTWQTAA